MSEKAAANKEDCRNILPLKMFGIQGTTASCLYLC